MEEIATTNMQGCFNYRLTYECKWKPFFHYLPLHKKVVFQIKGDQDKLQDKTKLHDKGPQTYCI